MLNANEFEDDKITPEGLKYYEISPPLNISSARTEQASNLPNNLNGEHEDQEEMLDGDTEHPRKKTFFWILYTSKC